MPHLEYKRRRAFSVRKEAKEQDRLRVSFERRLSRELINLFNKIGNKGANLFESTGTVGVTAYLSRTRVEVERTIKPFYLSIITTFAERLEDIITKRDSNFFTILTERFMNTVGTAHITDIDVTTSRILRRVISVSQRDGLSVAETAKRIQQRFEPRFSRARASTIARTETHSASSFANRQMGKELAGTGVTLMKQWVSTNDDRTRLSHRIANGTKIPMEEDFVVDGMKMKYTGDPNGGARNVINCRCVTIYVEEETELYDSPVSNARVNTPEPSKRFVGFGDMIPEEKVWHTSSWNNSPLRIKNLISVFPALNKVTRGGGTRGAHANVNQNVKPVYEKDKKVGNAYINMGGKEGDVFPASGVQQSIWRHEYGHTMDYQMNSLIPKDKLPKLSTFNEYRIPIDMKNYYSANFAEEIIDDRKAIAKKYKKRLDTKTSLDFEKSRVTILQKKGYLSDEMIDINKRSYPANYEGLGKNIDEKFILDQLEDGKIFTKKELSDMLLNNNGLKNMLDTLNKSFGQGNNLYLADRLVYINQLNKAGILKGEDGILKVMQEIAQVSNNPINQERILTFADYLGAVTNEAVGFGHGRGYYAKFPSLGRGVSTGHGTEAFANYIALSGDEVSEKIYKPLLKKFAPKLTKEFDRGVDNMQELVQ